MTDFTLQKLSKICKSSTSKELALLAIGYDAEMISADRIFDQELQTIFSSIPQTMNQDFYIRWNIYKKLNILMQRVNTNLAEMMIYRERLYMCHLLIELEPVFNTERPDDKLDQAVNIYVDMINDRIIKITNIKYIVKTLEKRYFDNHPFVSSHPIWNNVLDVIQILIERHNVMFAEKRILISNNCYRYICPDKEPDTLWSEAQISKILETAHPEYGGFQVTMFK